MEWWLFIGSAYAPQLKADGIVALAGSLDANWINEINLVPYGGPYQIQFLNGANSYFDGAASSGSAPWPSRALWRRRCGGTGGGGHRRGLHRRGNGTLPGHRPRVHRPGGPARRRRCDTVFLTGLPATTGPILGTGAKLESPRCGWASPRGAPLSRSEELLPLLKNFVLLTDGPEWGDEFGAGDAPDARRHPPVRSRSAARTSTSRPGTCRPWPWWPCWRRPSPWTTSADPGILEAQRQLGQVRLAGE